MKVNYIDLTDKTYNDLTAIRYVRSDKGQGAVWLWKCVCGKEVEWPVHRVKRGHTLSCGCRRSRDCKRVKKCRHCGEESLRLNRHGNPSSVCHVCYNKQTNAFKYRNRKTWMVQCAKLRAKRAGIPFNITEADIAIPKYCPVFGIKLELGNRKAHANSPSIDRFIPELGYVKGNITIISHRANMLKSNATAAELRAVADWLERMSCSDSKSA